MKDAKLNRLEKKFGLAVRHIRKKMGLTQENAADLAYLDRSYFGGIERGEHNISLRNIHKICIALNVTPSILFEFVDSIKDEDLQ